VLLIALAVIATTALGYEADRRRPHEARVASRGALNLLLYVIVPFIAYVNVAHLRLTAGVGAGLLMAYVAVGIVAGAAWLLAARVLALPPPSAGAVVCVSMLANTGYLGLPVISALLGTHQLAEGVAYDQLVSGPVLLTAGFAVGAALGTRAGRDARERVRAFATRNPPLLAVVAGLLVPPAAAPEALVHVSHSLVFVLLPLGFFALGVNLSTEAARRPGSGRWVLLPALDAPVASAIALRMGATPLIVLGLSAAIVSVPHAYLLQASMPSAINCLVVGHVFGLDLRVISAAVAWTTALALAVGLLLSAV
jgi:predicted permease